MGYGYQGQILHIDLTRAEVSVEKPSDGFYRKYMGGSALGMYYLLKNLPAGVDALDARKILIISVGGMTGASTER